MRVSVCAGDRARRGPSIPRGARRAPDIHMRLDAVLERPAVAAAEHHAHGERALDEPTEYAPVALGEAGVRYLEPAEAIARERVHAGLVEGDVGRVRVERRRQVRLQP